MDHFFRRLKAFPFEAAIWALALVLLAFMNPSSSHFSLCPLAAAGFDWCPGCGLGRSISLFFRGQLRESLSMHPFGIIAVIILSYRIVNLTKNYLNTHGKNH